MRNNSQNQRSSARELLTRLKFELNLLTGYQIRLQALREHTLVESFLHKEK